MDFAKLIAVVDPFNSGALLAPEFNRRGHQCVMVQSGEHIPETLRDTCRPRDFVSVVRHRDDLDETLARLRGLDIGLIVVGCETGVNLADALSEGLGLLTNGTEFTAARRNKYLMSLAVSAAGLRTPACFSSGRLDELLEWVRLEHGWPVVFKPLDSAGSDGIRVCRFEAELERAFECVKGRTNSLGLVNEVLMVQELLIGPQYVVDTVSYAGQHRLAAIWRYGKPAPEHSLIGLDSKEILPFAGETPRRLFDYAVSVLDALHIEYGPAHCELMWVDDEPVLMEVGARMHGGVRTPVINRLCTGTSQLDLTIQAYLEPDFFLEHAGEAYEITKRGVMVFLKPWRAGRLRGFRGLDEIERLPSFLEMFDMAEPGTPAPRVAGLVTLIHESKAVIDRDFQRIRCLERNGLYDIEDDGRAV